MAADFPLVAITTVVMSRTVCVKGIVSNGGQWENGSKYKI